MNPRYVVHHEDTVDSELHLLLFSILLDAVPPFGTAEAWAEVTAQAVRPDAPDSYAVRWLRLRSAIQQGNKEALLAWSEHGKGPMETVAKTLAGILELSAEDPADLDPKALIRREKKLDKLARARLVRASAAFPATAFEALWYAAIAMKEALECACLQLGLPEAPRGVNHRLPSDNAHAYHQKAFSTVRRLTFPIKTIRALPEDLSAYPNLAEHMQMERAQAAARDGKLYMIPRTTYGDITYSVLDRNVVYRWDLAQAAGITKEPETYEEFCDMIKAIIEADPEGKNISGMTQALPELIGGFVYPYAGIIDKKWVADEEGRFVPSYFADRDALVSAMQFARDMYTDGVIEKDIALAKLETSKEKYLQGQSAAMVFAWSGPAGLESQIGKDYDALYGEGSFLEDNRIAKLYPSEDGNSYYFVDTEAWSESYISAQVDDEKMAAICRLFDFLYSEEGQRLVYCGIEGEDYDVVDGEVVMKDGVDLMEKYTFKM